MQNVPVHVANKPITAGIHYIFKTTSNLLLTRSVERGKTRNNIAFGDPISTLIRISFLC
jgi:hypothetical protein